MFLAYPKMTVTDIIALKTQGSHWHYLFCRFLVFLVVSALEIVKDKKGIVLVLKMFTESLDIYVLMCGLLVSLLMPTTI